MSSAHVCVVDFDAVCAPTQCLVRIKPFRLCSQVAQARWHCTTPAITTVVLTHAWRQVRGYACELMCSRFHLLRVVVISDAAATR